MKPKQKSEMKPKPEMKQKVKQKPLLMEYLSELVHAQLENRIPEPIPEGIDLAVLEDIAHRGQMDYLILGALLKLGLPQEDAARLKPYVIHSTMKTLAQVCIAREVQGKLEAAGVRNQVLKGTVLKNIYPSPEMREMSDVDFMVYEKTLDQAEAILKEAGCKKHKLIKHHVIYTKAPHIILEMHWSLYDQNVDKDQYLYYKEHFRAVLKEGTKYTYEFSKEDFYVYMISHMAKHFYETGCGIRNILDVYIYNRAYGKVYDRKVIDAELETCGLTAFEKNIRELAEIWLDGKESNEFYNNLFEYMVDCGIYGKGENGVWGQFAKEKKDKGNEHYIRTWYYFPPLSYMEEYYPWLGKAPFLLPIAWVLRAIHGITNKAGMERKKMVSKIDGDKIHTVKEIYQKLDLDFKK